MAVTESPVVIGCWKGKLLRVNEIFCQFHKHFMQVNYSSDKISCTVCLLHVSPIQCFQNELAYFEKAVSYVHKDVYEID